MRYPFLRLALFSLLAAALALALNTRPDNTAPAPSGTNALDPDAFVTAFADGQTGSSVRAYSLIARGPDGQVATDQAGRIAGAGSAHVTADTPFEAASLSKPVVAWAILQLAREGRLDLDAVRTENSHSFTLNQVLRHTAGFDNALMPAPEPHTPAGAFSYAGNGYVYLGDVIEDVTGEDFADYMNSTILPQLGMTHSSFGPPSGPASGPASGPGHPALAAPALDAGLVIALGLLAAALILVPGSLLAGAAGLVFKLKRGLVPTLVLTLILTLGLAAGLSAPVLVFGMANAPVLLVIAGLALGLSATGFVLSFQRAHLRALAILPLALLIVLTALRPPLPLAERHTQFLAPAGLRTTPTDYLAFLDRIAADPAVTDALVPVTAHSDWGAGIGVTTAERPALWHWGVNFPGYQAFAVIWPDTGEAAIILTSGGQLSPTWTGSFRYSALELSVDALTRAGAPLDAYPWEGIQ